MLAYFGPLFKAFERVGRVRDTAQPSEIWQKTARHAFLNLKTCPTAISLIGSHIMPKLDVCLGKDGEIVTKRPFIRSLLRVKSQDAYR